MKCNSFGKAVAALALACAAAGAQAQPAPQAQPVIRLGNLKFAHYGAVSYIKEIAPRCGIRVEEHQFAKGLDVMQAIMAGELDVGATASEAAIAGRAGGAPIVAVAGFARGGARLVGRAALKLKSVRDLKGRRVGVTRGAIQEVLLMAELQRAGLSASERPGRDVQLVLLAYADLNQALQGGQIDAMMQSEPQSSQALARGYGSEIIKPYGTAIGEPVRTLVMTERFYTQRRALAGQFMRCFVEATRTFITQPAVAERYVREVLFKGQLSGEEFRAALANAPYAYDLTAEHIQATTDVMVQTGVGRMARPPLARDWVKTDLLAAAKRSLNVDQGAP